MQCKALPTVDHRQAVQRQTRLFDTASGIETGIRSTYDGPVTLADDFIVWNVTKDEIKVREVVVNPNTWPPAACLNPTVTTHVKRWQG